MNDDDFTVRAATLLAQCSPEQRTKLVKLAENFVSTSESQAMDRRAGSASRPLTLDEIMKADPNYGKTLDEMFPERNRIYRG